MADVDLDAAEEEAQPMAELYPIAMRGIERAIESSRSRIGSLRSQVRDPEEVQLWKRRGDGLQGLPRKTWRRGLREVKVPDYGQLDDEGQPVEMIVEVDPDKDFQRNAKECYKKARKLQRAIDRCIPMIEEGEAKIEQWEQAAESLKALKKQDEALASEKTEEEVRRVYEELLSEGFVKKEKPPPPTSSAGEDPAGTLRRKFGKNIDCFLSPSGLHVLAGRSAAANERVSFTLTLNDGLWFHAADGTPGSHVTIRSPVEKVTEEDMEFAASIAAWHSKGRDRGYTPVMYCLGHQLRKLAKRRTGQVHVSGDYKKLLVKPALPEVSD